MNELIIALLATNTLLLAYSIFINRTPKPSLYKMNVVQLKKEKEDVMKLFDKDVQEQFKKQLGGKK